VIFEGESDEEDEGKLDNREWISFRHYITNPNNKRRHLLRGQPTGTQASRLREHDAAVAPLQVGRLRSSQLAFFRHSTPAVE
jgi:hypothetical protein